MKTKQKNTRDHFDAKSASPEDFEEQEALFRQKFPLSGSLKTPPSYFDTLPSRIQDRIAMNDKRPVFTWISNTYRTTRPVLIPVSLVAAILIVTSILLPIQKKENAVATTDTTSSTGVYEYDASYAHEVIAFEEADVAEEIENSEYDLGTTLGQTSGNDTTLSQSEIIDYLNQNEIEPELLAEL
ncbi:MAG TPA: hypothetical protein PLP88_02385 [Bacteroidales bacterium]|nr:hypothetical protein [Bacteroidales bacterium]